MDVRRFLIAEHVSFCQRPPKGTLRWMVRPVDIALHQVRILADNSALLFSTLFVLGVANVIVPPVPVAIAAAFAGYLAGTGHGSLALVVMATTLGTFVGSIALYSLAARYGPALISRTLVRRFVTEGVRRRAEDLLGRYGAWVVVFSRYITAMNFASIFLSGALRVSPWKVIPAAFVCNLIFFWPLAVAASYLGARWRQVFEVLRWAGAALAVFAGISGFIWVVVTRLRRRSKR